MDYKLSREIERKFWLNSPKTINNLSSEYRQINIEQLYLSKPEDEYDLRVRKTVDDCSRISYTATLKTRPDTNDNIADRYEIETEISEETYLFWLQQNLPFVKKVRRDFGLGLTADFIEGIDEPLIELEQIENLNSEESAIVAMTLQYLTSHCASADQTAYSEQIAWNKLKENNHDAPILTADSLAELIFCGDKPSIENPCFISIGGRSGSGKSTIARELQKLLNNHFDKDISARIISTDDYNKGINFLQKNNGNQPLNFDLPHLYDTETLAKELKNRKENMQPLPVHSFDWDKSEQIPVIFPCELHSIIIIEGIYADSPEIADLIDFKFHLNIGAATCIGRRVMRSLNNTQRGNIMSPEAQLRYLIEIAEPTYLQRQLQQET